ncbi:hypothetical protein EVAR_31848_1 [Eumeta japonica]|uniref:Uncharacterized protein n=1 Tax=Eumeta variegata TaxID=151549 RepID=A0A4C1WJD5_EUMVA|nr:hypothetical protein EVAR_31848_1 [Eumeta japonica]
MELSLEGRGASWATFGSVFFGFQFEKKTFKNGIIYPDLIKAEAEIEIESGITTDPASSFDTKPITNCSRFTRTELRASAIYNKNYESETAGRIINMGESINRSKTSARSRWQRDQVQGRKRDRAWKP